MTEQRYNPHDSLFRGLLEDPADAASEIRPVVATQMSAALAARIDWTHLELQHCSFVSPELRNRFGDLLFRTSLDGHPAFVYILTEHQSSSDQFMALRMLDYMVSVWWRYLDQHEADRKQARERGEAVPPKARKLPAIIPLVVHNTAVGRGWSAPVEFTDLIDLDPAALKDMAAFLPRFRFLLDDVACLGLQALRERDLTPAARLVLMLQQIVPGNEHAGRDILEWLADELRALRTSPDAARKLKMVITYIIDAGDTDETELAEAFAHIGSREEDAFMTTAEKLRTQGRSEGRVEGRTEGRAEGRAETLIEQMTEQFGTLPDGVVQRIRSADLDQLRVWTRRVLRARTIDEVLI